MAAFIERNPLAIALSFLVGCLLSLSKSKTKKKGNYRSFLKCEMKRLKKANPNVRQASIMKMAAKNWNKA